MSPSRVSCGGECGARPDRCPRRFAAFPVAGRITMTALIAVVVVSGSASAQTPPGNTEPAAGQPASGPSSAADSLARWVDLQTANVLARFRYIENSGHVVTTRQLQSGLGFRARLKLDRAARVSFTGLAATGSSFTASWNNTGIGTGDPAHAFALRQLYLGVVPARGVEVAYGGFAPIRGESTEITSYDNDAYLVGERVSVRRPHGWFFDEISGTAGFLGDFATPNVFRRLDRLNEINYGQMLVSKKASSWLTASAEVTAVSRVATVRAAAVIALKDTAAVDTVRYEQYARTGEDAGFGYAATAEKALASRISVGMGYANIDPQYGGLNGDRYGIGRRVFEIGTIRPFSALSIAVFATQGFQNDFPISNHRRVDVVVTYNALATLKHAGLIR